MKSLLLSVLFICASAAAFAQGESQKFVRTEANQNEGASFTLDKAIYRTQWHANETCEMEWVTRTETYYENEWVPNNQYECTNRDDGSQDCNWVDRGSYQSVAHTRDVSSYENVCRDRGWFEEVYDHTWSFAVQVKFPADAGLLPGETETLVFQMAGSEGRPKITIDQSQAVLHYVIAKSKFENGTLNVELATKPYLSARDVGDKNLGSFAIEFGDESSAFSFVDKFSRARVTTEYKLVVTERKSKTVVGEFTELKREGNKFFGTVPAPIDSGKDYAFTLEVSRVGTVILGGSARFKVAKLVRAEVLDTHALKSASQIDNFSLLGVQDKLELRFRDHTKNYATAKSFYKVEVREDKDGPTLGSFTFSRKEAKTDRDGRFVLSLANDLKVDPAVLATWVKGKRLAVGITVTRQSKRLPADIFVAKGAVLKIRK